MSDTKQLRVTLVERDGSFCQWPGCRKTRDLTLHHLIPQAFGGRSIPTNLCLMCDYHHVMLHKFLRIPEPGQRYKINYHVVFCPKYRRKILTGMVASRLAELFKEIAGKWGFELIAQEVMPDHVHLFVSALPKFNPSKVAQLFKGTTSRVLRLEFPGEIKRHIYKVGTLWSPGYNVGTAGNVTSATIRHYIEECQKL